MTDRFARALPGDQGTTVAWVLPVVLLLPSIVWWAIDRAPWAWDEALYGEATVRYWAAWVDGPLHWLRAVMAGMTIKPPGMTWGAQFFLPLTGLGLTPEQAMLAFNLLAHLVSGVALADLVVRRCGGGAASAVAVAFLVMGAPLAVGMAHLFFVEATQFAVVAVIYWLCLARWPTTPIRQTVLLVFLAVLTLIPKLSTPVYCLWPMAIAGLVTLRTWYETLSGAGGVRGLARHFIDQIPRSWPIEVMLVLGTAFMAIHLVRNWEPLRTYLAYATVSEEALLFGFGHERPLLGKLAYWLESLQRAIADPVLLGLLALILAVGLLLAWRRQAASIGAARRVWFDVALVLAQVALVLLTYAQVRNEEWRYVLPLLAPIAILLGHALAYAGRTVAVLAAGVLALQFCLTHAMSFGVPIRPFDQFVWVKPAVASSMERDRVRRAVDLTCGRQTIPVRVLLGVEINELSDDTFAFYSMLAGRDLARRCRHGGFHEFRRRYQAGEIDAVLDEHDFVVTLRELWLLRQIPEWVRWANTYALPILERVRERPDFVRIERHDDGLVIFCRPRQGVDCGIRPGPS